MSRLRFVAVTAVGLAAFAPTASAQVAFAPQVSSFPNGVSLSATPVVSADRRYVRLTVNPQFTALEGFDTYSVPAAVSGGPGGPGAFRSMGIPGGTFSAGMDGVTGPVSSGYEPDAYSYAYTSTDASVLLSGEAGYQPRMRLAPASEIEPAARAVKRPAKRTPKKTRSLSGTKKSAAISPPSPVAPPPRR